jgi:hypothetical protein
MSCGGGTVNDPPGREEVELELDLEVDVEVDAREDELHAARSIVASTAATPPAVRKNRRRSIPA